MRGLRKITQHFLPGWPNLQVYDNCRTKWQVPYQKSYTVLQTITQIFELLKNLLYQTVFIHWLLEISRGNLEHDKGLSSSVWSANEQICTDAINHSVFRCDPQIISTATISRLMCRRKAKGAREDSRLRITTNDVRPAGELVAPSSRAQGFTFENEVRGVRGADERNSRHVWRAN